MQWGYLAAEEDALGVQLKGLVPISCRAVFSSVVLVHAGIVDRYVQPAKLFNDSGDHPAQCKQQ